MDKQQVMELVTQTLNKIPLSAERMTLTHSGNTIYDVTLPESHVIVRLRGSDKNTFSKTTHNIAALAELGLPVPRVLAVDTSLTRYPFRYIILEKLPGRDLLYELASMTLAQMTQLAEQIVSIQHAVATLPIGTGFGWGHIGEGGTDPVWFDVFRSEAEYLPPVSDGGPFADYRLRIHRQRIRFQPYFRNLIPICFLEDLTTKNVLLQQGKLQGLIDFDCVCFGDPLWMIGLAAGCIVNDIGRQELFYIQELCRCWNLTEQQQDIVAYYSAQRAMGFLEDAFSEQDEPRAERLTASIEDWLATLEQAGQSHRLW